jgi:hypothetical protein
VPAAHAEALFLKQVPADEPGAAQAAPAPQSATVQQTFPVEPVAQCPDWHCRSSLQLSPSAWALTHEPVLQKYPVAQSVSVPHVDKQELAPHAYAAHERVAAPHAPLPLHVETSISIPDAHDADPQAVVVVAL